MCVFVCAMWCVNVPSNPSFVSPGPRCQNSSRWWVTTSSESVFPWRPGNRSNPLLLLPDQSDSLELQPDQSDQPLSLLICRLWSFSSPSSPSSVENTDCRVTLVAFFTLHSPPEVNWMLLCGDVESPVATWLLQSGSQWELLTHSDNNGQKSLESQHPRIFSSCTTCFISIPSFKEQEGSIYSIYIYMRKGKHDKKLKCNWTQAMSRVQVGESCSKRSKTYHKVLKDFFFFKATLRSWVQLQRISD